MRKMTSFILAFILSPLAPVFTLTQGMNPPKIHALNSLGSHDIAELFGCNKTILSDLPRLEKILIQAARVAGAKKIGLITHQTADRINSCIVLISESHLSIHAFPLLGYAAVDVFTCGECNNEKAIIHIKQQLQAQSNHYKKITRGICKQGISRSRYNPNKENQKGEHLIVEFYGCEENIINDERKIEEILKKAAQKTGAQVIDSVPYKFHPQGVSCIVLAENGSQITIHTWPELSEKYCAIDILTCGNYKPDEALLFLMRELKSKTSQVIKIPRGFSPTGIVEHICPPEARTSAQHNSSSISLADRY